MSQSQLQNALRTLAEAMRGTESPEAEHDDEIQEEFSNEPPLRSMSYLLAPAKGSKQRPIVNAADDSPLLINTGYLLVKPEKKAAQ